MSATRSPAIQFYFRQFSGDEHVMAMDLQTVGCHILLICAAGASPDGYSLPNDEKILRSICRNIRRSTWKKIFKVLLQKGNGSWKLSQDKKRIEQHGLMRSFMKQQDFSNKQREKAKRRWDATALPLHNSGNATAMPASASASASASATSNTESNSNTKAAPKPRESELPGFAIFWEAYPNKVGKPTALRAWLSKVRDDSQWPEVLSGVEKWKSSGKWSDPQFIPYPATFLNQKRWQDDPPKDGGTKNEQRIKSVLGAAQRIMESGPQMGDAFSLSLSSGPKRAGNQNLLRSAQERKA